MTDEEKITGVKDALRRRFLAWVAGLAAGVWCLPLLGGRRSPRPPTLHEADFYHPRDIEGGLHGDR